MDPANPPVPTPWNFPFHVLPSGIQTSKLMCESAVGAATAATRQNAGTARGAAVPRGAGGVNVPAAASDVAETIEMSGIRRSVNAAHGELAAGAGRVHAI